MIEVMSELGDVVMSQMVDTIPAWVTDPAVVNEWHKQDMLQATASIFAALAGGVSDEYVRSSIVEIQAMPCAVQYDAFMVLYAQTINGHPHGMAADVLDELFSAWDQV